MKATIRASSGQAGFGDDTYAVTGFIVLRPLREELPETGDPSGAPGTDGTGMVESKKIARRTAAGTGARKRVPPVTSGTEGDGNTVPVTGTSDPENIPSAATTGKTPPTEDVPAASGTKDTIPATGNGA